mgnify:CR=1 FL=1
MIVSAQVASKKTWPYKNCIGNEQVVTVIIRGSGACLQTDRDEDWLLLSSVLTASIQRKRAILQ